MTESCSVVQSGKMSTRLLHTLTTHFHVNTHQKERTACTGFAYTM